MQNPVAGNIIKGMKSLGDTMFTGSAHIQWKEITQDMHIKGVEV